MKWQRGKNSSKKEIRKILAKKINKLEKSLRMLKNKSKLKKIKGEIWKLKVMISNLK
jgi:hypothetical protein